MSDPTQVPPSTATVAGVVTGWLSGMGVKIAAAMPKWVAQALAVFLGFASIAWAVDAYFDYAFSRHVKASVSAPHEEVKAIPPPISDAHFDAIIAKLQVLLDQGSQTQGLVQTAIGKLDPQQPPASIVAPAPDPAPVVAPPVLRRAHKKAPAPAPVDPIDTFLKTIAP